jgi:hypothetical protein
MRELSVILPKNGSSAKFVGCLKGYRRKESIEPLESRKNTERFQIMRCARRLERG